MTIRKLLTALAALAVLAAIAVAGVHTYDTWRGWFFPNQPAVHAAGEGGHHHHDSPDRLTLSPQARSNLKLVVKPIQLETYSRTIMIPGMVVERQGRSDRGVSTPIAGVVTRVAAVPGEVVRPGEELFTLRLLSESVQNSQTELYKTMRELEITQERKQLLEPGSKSGAIPQAQMLELDYQLRRFAATLQALRYDLAARGLTPEQIHGVGDGKFVTEITIRVPGQETVGPVLASALTALAPDQAATESQPVYEVEELKVQLGDQVQAGQVLCTLSNHHALYFEGRAFKHEAPLLEKATEAGWPIRAEFVENGWTEVKSPLRVHFLGNRVDPGSQTIPIYIPLVNQYREHSEDGKTYRIWRFRPGQRARLEVPVEQFPDVFVLPVEAVVREGPEVYVFRANGDAFDRKPVQVLHEDRQNAVIANDGSINVGNYVAHNGAAQLSRALKAKAAGGEGGHSGHDHAGHSHDH